MRLIFESRWVNFAFMVEDSEREDEEIQDDEVKGRVGELIASGGGQFVEAGYPVSSVPGLGFSNHPVVACA